MENKILWGMVIALFVIEAILYIDYTIPTSHIKQRQPITGILLPEYPKTIYQSFTNAIKAGHKIRLKFNILSKPYYSKEEPGVLIQDDNIQIEYINSRLYQYKITGDIGLIQRYKIYTKDLSVLASEKVLEKYNDGTFKLKYIRTHLRINSPNNNWLITNNIHIDASWFQKSTNHKPKEDYDYINVLAYFNGSLLDELDIKFREISLGCDIDNNEAKCNGVILEIYLHPRETYERYRNK